MTRRLYGFASVVGLLGTLYLGVEGALRGVPGSWILAAASCVVFGVITIAEFLPITSLNLTVKVTPENAPRIEPLSREFIASLKAYTMLLMLWIAQFIVQPGSRGVFFSVEGLILLLIFGSVFLFLGKLRKLA